MSEVDKKFYCYSVNEEDYTGACETVEAAIKCCADANPENLTCWVAVKKPAREFISAKLAGIGACDEIEKMLCDEIGADEPLVQLSPSECDELGKMILDFIEKCGGFKRHGVMDVIEYPLN